MRSFSLILVFFVTTAFQPACSSKPAPEAETNVATDSTAPTAGSPFANITDANVALLEGNRLLDDNQTELAIEAFKRSVELDPALADAYFKMGIAYALVEAEMLQSGIEVAGDAPADAKKGIVKRNSEKAFEKAVTAYKKILAASPKDHLAQFNLGRAYNKLNEDEDAEDAFKAAVKINPDDTEYQTELGAILIKLAKYREAIPALKKALELDPENLRAENLLEDAEAGAKRIDFAQPDKDAKKSNSNSAANDNVGSNANMPGTGNTSNRPANSNTKLKKDEPKDKRPEKTPARPNERRQ